MRVRLPGDPDLQPSTRHTWCICSRTWHHTWILCACLATGRLSDCCPALQRPPPLLGAAQVEDAGHCTISWRQAHPQAERMIPCCIACAAEVEICVARAQHHYRWLSEGLQSWVCRMSDNTA